MSSVALAIGVDSAPPDSKFVSVWPTTFFGHGSAMATVADLHVAHPNGCVLVHAIP